MSGRVRGHRRPSPCQPDERGSGQVAALPAPEGEHCADRDRFVLREVPFRQLQHERLRPFLQLPAIADQLRWIEDHDVKRSPIRDHVAHVAHPGAEHQRPVDAPFLDDVRRGVVDRLIVETQPPGVAVLRSPNARFPIVRALSR